MKNESERLIGYYQMLSLLYVSIGCIVLSTILFSCSSPSAKNPLLLKADSLMETQPDSALTILESISSPEKLSGADRAFYALLFTQAKHKNAIPLEDDSLIKIAVDYYGDKEGINAAKAHYYLGATYWDKGSVSFAVEEYLTAIRLMPERNDFLAMIYNNLGECYEAEDMSEVAMNAYRESYQMFNDKNREIYPLRGIARILLLQNNLDSALFYFQKALDYAIDVQDSHLVGALYHDIAMAYNEQKDYIHAEEFISKAITSMSDEEAVNARLSKADILFNMNKFDSASYYYNKDLNQLEITGRAFCYNGMYKIARKRGEWKVASEYMETYVLLYDSIQIMTDNKELARLMDRHLLEEHKRVLSEHAKMVLIYACVASFTLIFICIIGVMLIDRKRKKRIIDLQKELNQKRVDVTLLRDTEVSESTSEEYNNRKIEVIEQQLQLCKLVFKSTKCYENLEAIKKATPKQLMDINYLKKEIKDGVWESFVDVMNSLDEGDTNLTQEDRYFCILILLDCTKAVIMELMGGVSSDALKTRKNRIKNKMKPCFFKFVFESDYQYNKKK